MAKSYSTSYYIKTGFYFIIYGCVKYFPTPLGDLLRFMVLKIFVKKIKTTYIRDGVTILFPENVSIDKGTCINEWVWMDGSGGIEVGRKVLIAPGVCIISFDHGIRERNKNIIEQEKELGKVIIEDDVWLGAGAKNLCKSILKVDPYISFYIH